MKFESITSKGGTNKIPRVSVVCISYNQEKYIAQTIEGFLSQKTNFLIEIVIGDDASTDTTADIIRKYEKKHPGLFRVNLRKKNVGVQPNIVDTLKSARGEYIALCEGDDFWTDPLKLQKQVDFLDTHKAYNLVFHPVRVFFENHEEEDTISPEPGSSERFTVRHLLEDNYIQTNSVMYRRVNYDKLSLDVMPFDWYLHLTHAKGGKVGYIDEVMSSYRRHPGGIWWNQRSKPDMIWKKYGYSYFRLLHEIMAMYGDDEENKKIIIHRHIAGSYEAIALLEPESVAKDIALRSIRDMPSEAWDYILHLMQQVNHYSKHDTYLQGVLDSKAVSSEREINRLSDELNSIKSSRAWSVIRLTRSGRHTVSKVLARIKIKK